MTFVYYTPTQFTQSVGGTSKEYLRTIAVTTNPAIFCTNSCATTNQHMSRMTPERKVR